MVVISQSTEKDLFDILTGLYFWSKHELTLEHAESYVDDIKNICYGLDKMYFHAKTEYSQHKSYGENVYTYKRNNQTSWYIIYNIDNRGDIYINKIMSNHLTVK
ncbi:MAG: hypothetical protein LBV31_03295 [Prevotellaceae bacterium]|jgi:hypothetical protein|nr:hypothetical protein [Prevotellaceae bacterium]